MLHYRTHTFLSTVCLSDYHSGILLRQLSFSFYLMPAENKLKFFASKKGIIFLSYLSRGNGKASRRHFRNVPFPFGILCDRSPSWPKRGRFLYRIISIDSSTSRPRMSSSKSGNRYGLRIRRHNGERVIFLRREAWKLGTIWNQVTRSCTIK